MARKEASIQRTVVQYARDQGAIAIKLSTLGMAGTAGWPDYLFLCRDWAGAGKPLFVEFKREGGALTPLQKERHRQLEAAGFQPYVIDDVARGRALLREVYGWEDE